ncbi:MAG: integrin alpha, partial [Pseudomonadota bacterium]
MANAYFTTGSSSSVTGLDLNNDGIDDIVQSNAVDDAGRVTVIYGSTQGFDPTIDLSNIDPLDGFALTGTAVGDEFGYVLGTANDLLDNGEDALLIGSRAKGQVDVVFAGQTSIGFTVTGLPTLADGMSVAGLGDFNGDGIGDFAIGAPEAGDGLTFPGEVYVIFGSTTLSGTTLDVSALDGTNGFVINGFQQDAQAGASIAGAGDLNGDGFADLVIGAPTFDDFSNTNSGTAFIVYGSDGTIAAAENIDTSTNLSTTPLIGFAAVDEGGRSVGGGADVNGDNIPDVIVAAPLADPNGSSAGIAYVLFDPDPATAITLPDVDGSDGFVIEGLNANDQLGAAVGLLGDVSGDGIGDIGVLTRSGDLYIIYGTTANTGGSVDLSLIDQVGGPDGIVFTNLFDGDANTQVSLTSLGDINADQSGSINDISISAIGQGGTPLAAISILGGEANFAAMQAAAGSTGGTIDFSALPDDVDFVANDTKITIGGDTAATVTEDS